MAPQGLNVPGVPSMGRRRGLSVPGAAAASMPTGALGLYYADAAVTSPRKYIPNEAAVSPPTQKSLWGGGRMAFGTLWNAGASLTEGNAVGPDGLTQASTYTNASAGWSIARAIPLPAGTYTYAVWAKSNTGSSQTFRMIGPGQDVTKTATTSWQRFFINFTTGSTATQTLYLYNTTTAIDIQFCDADLFSGSSDLGAEGSVVGHLEFGMNSGTSASSGVLVLPNNTCGYIRMPTNTTFTNGWTTVALARRTTAGAFYTTVLSKSQSGYNTLGAHLQYSDKITLAGITIDQQTSADCETALTGSGWHAFTHRWDRLNNMGDIWIDGGVIRRQTGATLAAPTAGEFVVGGIDYNAGYGGGWDFAAIAFFPYALTKQQIRDAEAVMAARVLANSSISRSGVKFLFAEGDSLTADGNYPTRAATTGFSPARFLTVCAVPGSTYTTLAARAAFLTDAIPPSANRVSGSSYILTTLVANGMTVLSTYESGRTAYMDARTAEGWYRAGITTLPQTAAGANTNRATSNANMLADVGTRYDKLIDFAADAVMGPDAAASNTSLYSDGLHPTTSAQTTYLTPDYKTGVDSI